MTPVMTAGRAIAPELADTAALDELRRSQYGYLDANDHVYLDYTGAGLPAQAQLAAHAARLTGGCFGNPHSENPASVASTELIEHARTLVLEHFNASPDEYAVIFTPNASAACRLVGEAYPFGPGRGLLLTSDNHNSVNGIREFARASNAGVEYIPFLSPDLRVPGDAVDAALVRNPHERGGLFAFPAQSNFTGVQHDLSWIAMAREHGYRVLLDAAAYLPCRKLDLARVRPDFVPVSWYKVFGYPTGVGCLIARREALEELERPWFAGGTIAAVSVLADWHAFTGDETRFEDGTLNFLHVPDVAFGLSWINNIGLDVIRQRVTCLTGWMLNRLTGMRHGNGRPLIRLYGPADTRARGGTVAFNVLDRNGQMLDARTVARDAAAARISIRTGCFCNPGAAEAAFGLGRADLEKLSGLTRSAAGFRDAAGVGGGAIRASVGLVSNLADVEALLRLLETRYTDCL
ncbi:MAG TPA: aminotransferase class V-fold PLP-dependent enzyme [Streptosporangiaceae bacterium]|jgi:selenocysteine lyase/cysteine desulfurase|nr:aminotransferase class V-fold PLP-dependent enzyme [Streptosporangiaceae bacterium]